MADLLRMQLLGYPELSLGGVALTFRRRKTVALLAYLVLNGRPVARDTLAALLSDEVSEPLALQTLRASLAELREHVREHLLVSRQTLAFDRTAPHWVDTQEFQRRFAEAEGRGARALAQATKLYAGELLAGFTLRGAPGFNAWLAGERQRLRDIALSAWQSQLDAHAAEGDLVAGLAVAEQLLTANPTAELTYRKAMALLAEHGQRDRALELYERCRASLGERLGVMPSPETTALYERIRGEALARPQAPPARAHAAPAALTDLELLVECLADPLCRLVTLLAPTPAAATTVALRAVTHFVTNGQGRHHFPDGIYVTAAGRDGHGQSLTPRSLSQQIGQALGPAAGATAGGDLLPAWLFTSTMLLVLDSLTPTDEEVMLVAEILRRAPRLTLLVLAGGRLFLQEEWVLDVGEARSV